MGHDPIPKLGKGHVNCGTLRQWNVMLLLKGIKFTDSFYTSKCTCKIMLKEKNPKENVHTGYRLVNVHAH